MSRRADVIVCRLVGNSNFVDRYAAVNGGIKRPCDDCMRAMWISPPGQESMKQKPGVPVLCFECFVTRQGDRPFESALPPGARDELAKMDRAFIEEN